MFEGNFIHLFRKLPLGKQIYALCLTARERVSDTMVLSWMEAVKGNPLSPSEIFQITKIYEHLKNHVDWGNHEKNNPILVKLGLSVKDMNGILADILWDWMGLDKKEFPG